MTTLIINRQQKTSKYPLNIDAGEIFNKYGFLIMNSAICLSQDFTTIEVNPEDKDFITYIKSIRTTAALSQVQLADMSSLTSQYISQVENGKKVPKDSTLIKILDVLFNDKVSDYVQNDIASGTILENKLIHIMDTNEKKQELETNLMLYRETLDLYVKALGSSNNYLLLALITDTLASFSSFNKFISDEQNNEKRLRLIELILAKIENGLKALISQHPANFDIQE